jgi:ribose/xylose/arabinose/galactoside ABC-type transport system permease subunit
LELSGVKSQYVVIIVGLLLIVTAVFNEWMARHQGESK